MAGHEDLVDHDAIVDKFVGDEVMAIFIPVLTEDQHARHAVDAGRALLTATGNATSRPWVPVGVGVNTGVAFVGELLATVAAAEAAGVGLTGVEHRRLELKGKTESTDVVVLGAA